MINAWLRGIRPIILTASIIPVTLGAVLALDKVPIHFGYFFLSAAAMILIHAGVNLLNDHDDYLNGVDTEESFGSSRVVVEKLLSLKQVSLGGNILVLCGAVLGIYLAASKGWGILVLGLFGIAMVYSYTGKPLCLKYNGMGLAVIFLVFGPLPVLGSFYVQTSELSLNAMVLSIPIGLMTTAILQANELRDMVHDRLAGIRTLTLLIGNKKGKKLYITLLVLPYLLLVLMICSGFLPYWSLLVVITLPIAHRNIKILNSANKNFKSIIDLDKKTAQLQAQFGVLFVITVLLSLI